VLWDANLVVWFDDNPLSRVGIAVSGKRILAQWPIAVSHVHPLMNRVAFSTISIHPNLSGVALGRSKLKPIVICVNICVKIGQLALDRSRVGDREAQCNLKYRSKTCQLASASREP
jgi:hypothetical protein